MPERNVIRKDAVARTPTVDHEGPNPVKSAVVRLGDKNGKKRFAVNGDSSNKRYGSYPRTKWSYWFKYWNF